MFKTSGAGQYQVGEQHRLITGRLYRPGEKRPVAYCPGVGANALTFLTSPHDPVPKAVANAGLPVGSFDFGGSALWGNDTARTRVGTARTFMHTRLAPRTDKLLLIGGSMGGATALRWAIQNPTQVAAIALFIPAVDLQDIVANNRGGYAASVTTAYGGTPTDAQNPADQAATLVSIPITIWYASDDPICAAATVQAFGAACGATMVNMGAVGHSFSASTYAASVTGFLGAYA